MFVVDEVTISEGYLPGALVSSVGDAKPSLPIGDDPNLRMA